MTPDIYSLTLYSYWYPKGYLKWALIPSLKEYNLYYILYIYASLLGHFGTGV